MTWTEMMRFAYADPPYEHGLVDFFARQARLGWDSWGHGYEGVA